MKGFISVICHEGRAEAAAAVVGCWRIDAWPLPIFRRGFYFVLGLWYNLWRFVEVGLEPKPQNFGAAGEIRCAES